MKNSLSNQSFKQILFNTKSLQIRDLFFYYKNNNIKSGISFIVSRNKGNAVLRNLFKRRCRGLFSQNMTLMVRKKTQIIIKPKKCLKNNYTWKELSLSFEEFFSKLKI